jgi:DDE superfamily endonuclease
MVHAVFRPGNTMWIIYDASVKREGSREMQTISDHIETSVSAQPERLLSSPAHDSVTEFAARVFTPLPRADQRRWAETYLRGILMAGGRKSVRGIADSVRIFRSNQSLQQFINQSPWEWAPVRALVARYSEAAREPEAWLLERIIIPKRGECSVGVQRRFVPELGRTVNSQLLLSVALVGGAGTVPVDWRIALGGEWGQDPALRRAAYVPESVAARPEWAEILEMFDEMRGTWGLTAMPLIGDMRYLPDGGQLLARLAARDVEFSLQVDGALPVMGVGRLHSLIHAHERAPAPAGPQTLLTVEQYLDGILRQYAQAGLESAATPGRRTRIFSAFARLPHSRSGFHIHSKLVRVIGEWSRETGFTRFWITDMIHRDLSDIARLDQLAAHSRTGDGTPGSEFGLRDFEGRSYRGLHHHLTMVSAAFAVSGLDFD